jgi:hypothetical protein
MLGAKPFYYRTIRRNVIAFGSIFNNIEMIKYAANTTTEISRINVPLTYAGKEDFLTRLLGNQDLHKPTQILLPRMSFEMTNIAYDPTRKLSSYLSSSSGISGSSTAANKQYQGVPYNLDFELNLYVRNVEDGTQIIEQILPFFNPDYTISMSFVDEMNITRDVPIILEDIKYEPSYQGPAETTVRTLIWTLTFKMKTYFFGPISTSSIIRTAIANSHFYTGSPDAEITLNLNSGFGGYKIGETVYQGVDLPDALVRATVVSWNNTSNVLVVTNQQGNMFNLNANVVGSLSRADYGIINYSPEVGVVEQLTVTPNPITANIGDDFGFTENIIDFE